MRNVTNPIFNDNRMKLGIFCTNGRGASMTTVPEQKETDWAESLRTAKMADAAGFEAIVPFARWKGYLPGKPQHFSGRVFDPFIFAAGIAQATNYSAVFSTSHVPTIHPILAAKQGATVDHISGGRFALNVVGGWNRPELEMFGNPMKEHDKRYDHADEWLSILQRLWTETEEFTHHGEFFDILLGMSEPKPVQAHVPIMNAGGSDRGRHFAAKNADMCFVILHTEDEATCRRQVDEYKTLAREAYGREVQVWIHTYVVQRDTQKEAEDYLNYFAVENRDEECLAAWMAGQAANTQVMPPDVLRQLELRFSAGAGGFPLVGTAERIADKLQMLERAGVAGALLTWVDYGDGIARWSSEVSPLLEQAGLRRKFEGAGV